jgi:RNA polymerase sigma-70 factor (ECF subfamily)
MSPFAPTRWTLVQRARGETPAARQALGELCEAYWNPVFRFIRQQGRDDDTARELTQEFFARLLARHGLDHVQTGRGKFRSFLLGAVKHFLADTRDHEFRLKRGGGRRPESLDSATEADTGLDTSPGLQVPDPNTLPQDAFFDRQWALAVMERALAALAREFVEAGKSDQFDVLKPWLVGESPTLSQADAARRLGLSEGAAKVAVHRLRKRFRELIRSELAQTLAEPNTIEEELRYLVEVLSAVQ